MHRSPSAQQSANRLCIKKIYADSELEEDLTIRNFRIVQTEGSRQVTRSMIPDKLPEDIQKMYDHAHKE